MDVATARGIAHASHLQQRDRFGRPRIEHIERVAAGVPAEARTLAFLHDVLEWTGTDLQQLRAAGLTGFEERVMELLTRRPDESFELHALRVAAAQGEEGRIARVVRLADLDDHLPSEIHACRRRPMRGRAAESPCPTRKVSAR